MNENQLPDQEMVKNKDPGFALPPYSVILSVFKKDCAVWFDQAVKSMANQSFPPDEILIIEDGPVPQEISDVERKYSAQYPGMIRCLSLPRNMGLAEAMRFGVNQAKNEWIARMDADDIADPFRCEKELRLAIKNGADMVSCNYKEFYGSTDHVVARRIYPADHASLARLSRRRSPLCHAAVMMKKGKVIEAGNYRGDYVVEDYDLFIRMLISGAKCCTVNEFLYYVRVGDDYYQRRGGWKYVKNSISFNLWMLKAHWSSPADFFIRSASTAIVGLSPRQFRSWFYKAFLRN